MKIATVVLPLGTVILCSMIGYALGVASLIAFVPMSSVLEQDKIIAAFIGVIGGTGGLIVVRTLFQREAGENELVPKIPVRPQEQVSEDKELRKLAKKVWDRKEQWKAYARRVEQWGVGCRDNYIHYRARVAVWRTAFVFAFFHFLAAVASTIYLAYRYPDGTANQNLPWNHQYLNFLLLVLFSASIPVLMYRRYLKEDNADTRFTTAMRIGPGAVFLGAFFFFLQLTPEMFAFTNAGGVLLPPIPFVTIHGISDVPLIVFVGIQKIVLLPLIASIAVIVYREFRRM